MATGFEEGALAAVGIPTKAPAKTPAPPKPKAPVRTGMAGLYGGIGPTAYVNSLYDPQQAALAKQQAARTATLQQLVSSILASLNAPRPDAYGAAQQDQMSSANGAANTLLGKNPNDQTQAMLRAIGAPQSQQDQVAGQNTNTFGGGAALDRYVGGTLPAGVFGQDAAARQTYLSSLPALVGTTAIAGLGRLNQLASQENMQLGTAKATAQQNALADLAKFVSDRQKTQFSQGLATAKYNTGINEFNARQKLSMTRLQWQQSNADRTYGLSYAKFVAAENKAAALAKSGGITPYERNTLAGKVQDYIKGLYQGVPGHVTYPNATNGLKVPRIDSWKQAPQTYQQAIKTLIRRYPALGASGAIDAANALYQPGEGGRPLQPSSLNSQYGVQGPQAPGASRIVQAASKMLGTPYVWGGNSPGKALDCSGFIQQSYRAAGINFPWRTTYEQVKHGTPVGLNQLQPGDAIFTIPSPRGPKHVGMYIGNGMVQVSPTTGDVNKIVSLQSYLALGFVAARRYLGSK